MYYYAYRFNLYKYKKSYKWNSNTVEKTKRIKILIINLRKTKQLLRDDFRRFNFRQKEHFSNLFRRTLRIVIQSAAEFNLKHRKHRTTRNAKRFLEIIRALGPEGRIYTLISREINLDDDGAKQVSILLKTQTNAYRANLKPRHITRKVLNFHFEKNSENCKKNLNKKYHQVRYKLKDFLY